MWFLVEKTGMLVGLKGYEKLSLAMEVFSDKFYEAFGREPAPGDGGWEVKVLRWLCRLERKDDVRVLFSSQLEESEGDRGLAGDVHVYWEGQSWTSREWAQYQRALRRNKGCWEEEVRRWWNNRSRPSSI